MKRAPLVITALVTAAVVTAGIITSFKEPKEEQTLTLDEWQVLTKVLDYELKENGDIENLNGNALDAVIKELEKRPIDKDVVIEGQTLSASDYKLLRSGLFEKVKLQHNDK